MEYTLGPWKTSIVAGDHYGRFKGCNAVRQADENEYVIAICPNEGTIRSSQANARLIAATPELLEACKEAKSTLKMAARDIAPLKSVRRERIDEVAKQLERVIAKAEGMK